MPAKPVVPPPPPPAEPQYPNIEGLIERATPEEVGAVFAGVKSGLSALKGPRAEQAKKVKAAIESAQELLGYLLEVRDRLAAERQTAKGRK